MAAEVAPITAQAAMMAQHETAATPAAHSDGHIAVHYVKKTVHHPPFGSGAPRFTSGGYHPRFLKPEEFIALPREKEMRLLGPGCYTPCNHTRTNGDSLDMIAERRCQRSLHSGQKKSNSNLGPGSYQIEGFIEKLEKKPSSRKHHVCGTQETRFQSISEKNAADVPGPGNYKVRDITDMLNERPRSLLGICDATVGERFPWTARANLGPFYNRKSVIDESLEHGFSKRGIYDLTSGARFRPSLEYTNKLGPGEYHYSSFTDELNKGTRKKHGIVYHAESAATSSKRQSSVSETPGPAYYKPYTDSEDPRPYTAPPFGSKAIRFGPKLSRFPEVNDARDVFPGPGFYADKPKKEERFNGHKSAFISATKRFK